MWPLNNFPQQYGNQPTGFAAPKPNSNFGNFSNFSNAFAQVQPKPGQGMPWGPTPNMGFSPWPNMPVRPNQPFLPGPNMGFNTGPNLPNPNLPFQPMSWQPALYEWKAGDDYFAGLTKGGTKDGVGGTKDGVDGTKDGKSAPLSGKGSIDGVNFKSGDGERYELKVEAGKSYNLLSDAGIGLNGTYGKDSSGETVLTDIALSVGGKIVTLADDGTLRVDGNAFDKKKNNLEGLVTENKDGTYTVKANGYEFELKASENGIKVKIDAKSARTPEGLWGVALDGEKNTEKELQKAIKESDYKIDDALTFDYEDNNNIGDKYMPDLDDEERSDLAWNARNTKLNSTNAEVDSSTGRLKDFHMNLNAISKADGERKDFGVALPNGWLENDAYWQMPNLQSGRFYNVFSDSEVQVNGKFENGKPTELGFMVNGDSVRVEYAATGMKLWVNGEAKTSDYENNGIKFMPNAWPQGKLQIQSECDEGWFFEVANYADPNTRLALRIEAKDIGANDVRSSGLLGDGLNGSVKDNGNDKNGAGYLRNVDGSLSKAGQDMSKALREYLVDSWDDTSSGRSVYE